MAERAAYLRDGGAIYQRSFAIIRSEADLSQISSEEADVAVRMIHACGQVDVAQHIVFGRGLVAAARGALGAGAPISATLKWWHTASRARGSRCTTKSLHAQRSARAAMAERNGTTRSAAALDLWRDRLAGAVVAIGNAPTALFRLLEMIDAGAPKPAAILGIPVGFVGAAESKEALAQNPRGVPFLIVRGRVGGSAMTAAAINAWRARIMSADQADRRRRRAGRSGIADAQGDAGARRGRRDRAFCQSGKPSHSRAIAAHHLRAGVPSAAVLSGHHGIAVLQHRYRDAIGDFYDKAAAQSPCISKLADCRRHL